MNSTFAENTGSPAPLVKTLDLNKSFVHNDSETKVLQHINLNVCRGESLAVVGPSGAGKSTLLHILGTLDRPSSGTLLYGGEELFTRDQKELAGFRNAKIGFIFQFHHLMPEFNALENAMMPALISGWTKKDAADKAQSLLVRLGLQHRLTHKQGELSGGEQQRVAIARALVMEPEMVLADEPTGNLDSHTGREVFDLLLEVNREQRMTLVVVTHNKTFAEKLPRCIELVDGSIVN